MGVEARQIQLEDGRYTIADKSYVGALVRKWGALLEGMPDRTEHDRYMLGVLAILMENEAHHLKELTEDTRSVNVGSFTKFVFPVLRRVFPNLITPFLISVQPMTAPVGAVFYLDYVYGTSKGATSSGAVFPKDFDRDYTSEYVNGEIIATGNVAGDYGGASLVPLAGVLAWNPVRPLSVSLGFSVIVRELNATTGATVQQATDDGAGGFTGNVQAGASINYSNGAITAFKFTNAPANGNPIKVYYYYDGELNTKVPEMKLDVKQVPIQAVPRKIRALWSSEAAEDLRAMHGVEAETEIISAVGQEIALEIDRENINEMYLNSTGTSATFDRIPPAGVSEVEHLAALITPIALVSNLIHKKTLRAPANWIVTSPEVSSLMMQLSIHGDYKPVFSTDLSPTSPVDMPEPLTSHGQFSIFRAGTLKNKWTLYEDPFFTRDMMLIGLKGRSYLDAGYVWAPYIPLQVTPTFLDPADFSLRKGMRSRYGKKMLRPDFYGQLRILNL
jgi:hypothetical protein